MTTAVGSCIEVAEFRWGQSDLGATTDVTWIKVAFSRAGAIRLIGYDMGPQTEKLTGHYD